jgi:hypothetical protein
MPLACRELLTIGFASDHICRSTPPPHVMVQGVVKMAGDKQGKKTIVFLHPDLGIGGAERLVVDAAVGLQKRGHRVVIFTSHCDAAHCFDEARDGI